ncbi:MAG: PqiC family protein [Pseudomonadales bacterium]|nr:PqiC family protein [Pseudomonadales bacterium]
MNKCLLLVLLVLQLILVGCGSSAVDPVRYYLIDPVDAIAQQVLVAGEGPRIQIIGLHIPQYLDRYQLARRTNINQLVFADNHQWAESLRKNLLRTLSRSLSVLLNTTDIGTPVNRSSSAPEYKIQVFIEQFDQANDGAVVLSGRYQISAGHRSVNSSDNSAAGVLVTNKFEFRSDSGRTDITQMVARMQILFNQLCIDLASTLARLNSNGATAMSGPQLQTNARHSGMQLN